MNPVWLSLGLLLAAGSAAAQTVPSEWRRTDMNADILGASAFTPGVDGAHRATVVMLTPVDRRAQNGAAFRGVVVETEVRCRERMWSIVGVTHYAADLSVVQRVGAVPEAPLVRETPLHAAVTDVCDGGHTGAVELTTEDPVQVLRWLGGR